MTLNFIPDLLAGTATGSMSEQAYRALKREIIELRQEPGSVLSEKELGAKLGFSKTPVREALMRLQRDGLVRPVPRSGHVVTSVTLADATELCDMRVVLQSAAAAAAAARGLSQQRAERLEELVEDTTHDSLGGPNLEDRLRSNYEFEAIIANSSGNARLARSAVDTFDEFERVIRLALRIDPSLPPRRAEERRRIVDAILTRNAAEAERAMHERTVSAKQEVLEWLAASPSVVGAAISPASPN